MLALGLIELETVTMSALVFLLYAHAVTDHGVEIFCLAHQNVYNKSLEPTIKVSAFFVNAFSLLLPTVAAQLRRYTA